MMAAPNRLLAAVDKSTSWGGRFEGGIDFRGVQLVAQVTLLNHDGERVPNPPQGVKKVGDDDAFVMNRGMVYYAGLAARITLWSFLAPAPEHVASCKPPSLPRENPPFFW
jgi:hypothetical protein